MADVNTINKIVPFVSANGRKVKGGAVAAPAPALAAASAPAAYAAAPAPALTPAPVASAQGSVEAEVKRIIAEKTGYPVDMLEDDADLEADLGIDTIKQVEIFSAMRKEFDIPEEARINVADVNTINKIVPFVSANGRKVKGAAVAATASIATVTPPAPIPTVVMDEKIKRYEVISVPKELAWGEPVQGVKTALVFAEEERTYNKFVQLLKEREITAIRLDNFSDEESLTKRLEELGPVDAYFHVLPVGATNAWVYGQDLAAQHEAIFKFAKSVFIIGKHLAPNLKVVGASFTGSGTWMKTNVLGGALGGFFKTYKKEYERINVKAVDFAEGVKNTAEKLIQETLDNNSYEVEVGYTAAPVASIGGGVDVGIGAGAGTRHIVKCVERVIPADTKLPITCDTVFFVTGGAQGIMALIMTEMAKRYRNKFIVASLEADATELVTNIKAAGGDVVYTSTNVMDPDSLAKALEAGKKKFGRVDGVVHTAGLEISKPIRKKEYREFSKVFDVKITGLVNLMHVLRNEKNIKVFTSFTSVAGVLGNNGQCDYAASNNMLNNFDWGKFSNTEGARTANVAWTAWDGAGMAVKGGIIDILKMAGIDFIPPETGIQHFLNEVQNGSGNHTAMFCGNIQAMDILDYMKAEKYSLGGFVVKEKHQFLKDHAIENVPYVPGVCGIEVFKKAAAIDGSDDRTLGNIVFGSPIKVHEGRSIKIAVSEQADGLALVSFNKLNLARNHFTGQVIKLNGDSRSDIPEIKVDRKKKMVDQETIYTVYFHGPSFQVMQEVNSIGDDDVHATIKIGARHRNIFGLNENEIVAMITEGCFQTAGIWDIVKNNLMSLPHKLGRVEYVEDPSKLGAGLYYVVARSLGSTVHPTFGIHQGKFQVTAYDTKGKPVLRLHDYEVLEQSKFTAGTNYIKDSIKD